MSVFEEYINSLDKQENIDPTTVASNLHDLYKQEIGTREAKISELTNTVAEKDSVVAEKDAEISKWKAKNFDLVMQVPGSQNNTPEPKNDDAPTGANIKIGDLFTDKVRKRHGL